MKKEITLKKNSGITLIALVVTIIVLLILASISITVILGDNGLIEMAKEAGRKTNEAVQKEQGDIADLTGQLEDMLGGSGPQVTVDGKTVTLTKENVKDYLGRKVTNFKTNSERTETVGDEYQVSTTYRLYYVDFENKYGDGKGTVYLKADCTENIYEIPTSDTSVDTLNNIKIRNLNPELYKKENGGAPDASNDNMKAVSWLLDTKNWESLKQNVNKEVQEKINYIVGAPSLEMMMDSYNTHYDLKGTTPDYTEITEEGVQAGKRVKLFYKYNKEDVEYGYKVGPCGDDGAEYGSCTPFNSVSSDWKIDTMYYPGYENYYWLASPSAFSAVRVMFMCYGVRRLCVQPRLL